MSDKIKFANGTEFPLAATPEISGGYGSVLITSSVSVTAESVRAIVSDYNNTKSFQISSGGIYGAAITYYFLSGNVSLDGNGNIVVPLKQKTADQIDTEKLKVQNAYLQSALAALQASK